MEKEKFNDGATECSGIALGAVAGVEISAVMAGSEGAIAVAYMELVL